MCVAESWWFGVGMLLGEQPENAGCLEAGEGGKREQMDLPKACSPCLPLAVSKVKILKN